MDSLLDESKVNNHTQSPSYSEGISLQQIQLPARKDNHSIPSSLHLHFSIRIPHRI